MTEDKAIGKWCPMAHDGSDQKCIGSQCMAWRFSNKKLGHELSHHTRSYGEEEGRKSHARFIESDPLLGYCGLAGKP